MQLYCQTCQAAFSAASHCPKCGGRLLSPQESFIYSGAPKDPPPDPVAPTFSSRVLVGVGAGLGLYFGLRELAIACGALTAGGPWLAEGGAVELGLRLVCVLVGAVLAGAGREPGLPAGLLTGALAAGLLAAADIMAAGGPAAVGWMTPAAVAVLAALGGAAGAVGSRVWPPDADLPQATPATASSRGSSLARLADDEAELRKPRPTAWARILAGAALAAVGLLVTEEIRHGLHRGTGGLLQTGGNHVGPQVGFQIAVCMLALGGVVAGAGTGAGFRHGLLAGVLAAVGIYLAAANRPDAPYPAIDGYFLTFDRKAEPVVSDPRAAAEVLGLVTGLCTFGGWLGGQLFLPLAPPRMRNKRLVAQT
jgi:hypothetical protein